MDDAERARIKEQARIQAKATAGYGFKLLLKVMLVVAGILVLGLATCTYITLHTPQ